MGWEAHLTDDHGERGVGEWNFTHNCNRMANNAAGPEVLPQLHWWARLGGMSGPEGAAFLDGIIRGLEADPERFREMNPANGWGDYDSFVGVLTEMRNAVPEWPTTWTTGG